MTRLLKIPELIPAVLLAAVVAGGLALTPAFRDLNYLLESTSLYAEVAVMALAMTFVIISGNIDLSVASGLALIACTCAQLSQRWGVNVGANGVDPSPWPMIGVIAVALGMGLVLGLFNGLLVSLLRLPSLTVTLGTMALYRGLAQVLVGDRSVGDFPAWFVGLDYRKLFGPAGEISFDKPPLWQGLPAPLFIFLVLAVIALVLLHKTTFGRSVYAIGTNEEAARFSGLRVDRTKIVLFMLSGLTMGLGAVMMMSRLTTAQYSFANSDELSVITIVVLGGTDIFGGRGSIAGTVLAVFLLGLLKTGMDLRSVQPERQLAVTGTLLVVAVLATNGLGKLAALLARARANRPAARGFEPVT